MSVLAGLYPLATNKGLPIPLDAARCVASAAIVAGESEAYLVSVGSLLQVYSPILVRIAITNAASVDLSATVVADSFYLPPGATAVLYANGVNVHTVAVVPGQTGVVYINQLDLWQATARELELISG